LARDTSLTCSTRWSIPVACIIPWPSSASPTCLAVDIRPLPGSVYSEMWWLSGAAISGSALPPLRRRDTPESDMVPASRRRTRKGEHREARHLPERRKARAVAGRVHRPGRGEPRRRGPRGRDTDRDDDGYHRQLRPAAAGARAAGPPRPRVARPGGAAG